MEARWSGSAICRIRSPDNDVGADHAPAVREALNVPNFVMFQETFAD